MGAMADYLRALLPPWLAKPCGLRFQRAFADVADELREDAAFGVREAMLEEATDDALPAHGRNSGGLSQAVGEASAAYRAYLRQRWLTWQGCGTVPGLQAQLARLDFPAAEIWTELDLTLSGISAFGGTQGAFFVLLRKPHAIQPAAALKNWNDGQLWTGETTWGGTTATWAQLAELASTIRRWKPATTSCRFLLIELDAAQPVVLGLAAGVDLATGVTDDLLAVCEAGGTVWAVGIGGAILRYDGTWTVETSGVAADLRGVWGLSIMSVWAVGSGGVITRWNGAAWSPVASGTAEDLNGVWGANGGAIWAVGNAGIITRWNGATWSTVTSGTPQDLFAVWGTSASNIWAVGGGGVILHWDGAAWAVAYTAGVDLRGIWGAGASDLWAVGNAGTVLHYDGAAWSPVASGTTEDLLSVSGAGASVVVVPASGAPRRWDGRRWQALYAPAGSFQGVVAADGQVWAVGLAGLAVRFAAADFSGHALVVPVGETWEIDPITGGRVEFYNYSYLRERVS